MAGARGLANQVRAGLEPEEIKVVDAKKGVGDDPLDLLWMGKSKRQHLKEFGALFGTIFLAIAAYRLLKGQSVSAQALFLGLAAAFAGSGFLAPALLAPVWSGWMKLAHYLSIVMTFVILGAVWCIGFLPMAAVVRLFGIKVVDQSYGGSVQTYWVKRDPKFDDFSRMKQQY